MQGYDLLAVTRIQAITEVIMDELAPINALAFLNNTPIVPALDEEIIGQHEHNLVIADIIPDDQSAVVRSGGKITLTTTAIPNVKQGGLITQSILNLLRRINNGGGIPQDNGIIRDYVRNELVSKINACRLMMNRMICGMHMDYFNYAKHGVIYNNVSWGMDSTQKVVPSTGWDQTTSTPIDDLLTFKTNQQQSFPYRTYDYVRLSFDLFRKITATTNFKDNAKLYAAAIYISNVIEAANYNALVPIFEQATGLKVFFEDATYRDEINDGTKTTNRVQPINVAILGTQSDLNNAMVMDFGNAIVNETEIGVVPGTQVVGGGFTAPAYGPISYATIKGDLNPPNVTLWSVVRGFPRKKDRYATARVLAYGTLP